MKKIVVFSGAEAFYDSGLPLRDAAAEYIIKSAFKKIGFQPLWT